MSQRAPTYRRSVFSRLITGLTLAPAIVFTIISAWSAWQSYDDLTSEINNQINDDMASLSEIYIEQGPDDVSGAIVQRLSLSPLNRAGAHYLFKSKANQILSGDLLRPLSDEVRLTQSRTLKTENFGDITARQTIFKGGETLIVARENKALQASLLKSLETYLIGVTALLLLAYLLARGAIANLRQRIGAMNTTLDYVGQGHLDARLAAGDSSDELGILGTHINNMIARAERLLNLRKRVTDQVAHEMRSPLTRLDARLLSLAKTQSAFDDSEIERAREELQSCVKLLDGLLDVSSLDAQQGDKRGFEPINLSELVGNIVELFDPVAEDAGKTLSFTGGDNINLEAAPAQIGRLASNLIDNAIKYSEEDTDIQVSLSEEGSHIVLRVSNKGAPILGAAKENIFTPFFRHPDMADRQGYGLGLALCRAIALRHDGAIEVEPNPQSTVFKVLLPLAQNSA
ncbi:MAG: HAMP domain-containing sensor histidine kinase [Hellea sp.]